MHTLANAQMLAFSAENQGDNYKAISRQILTGSLTEGIWQLSLN